MGSTSSAHEVINGAHVCGVSRSVDSSLGCIPAEKNIYIRFNSVFLISDPSHPLTINMPKVVVLGAAGDLSPLIFLLPISYLINLSRWNRSTTLPAPQD